MRVSDARELLDHMSRMLMRLASGLRKLDERKHESR